MVRLSGRAEPEEETQSRPHSQRCISPTSLKHPGGGLSMTSTTTEYGPETQQRSRLSLTGPARKISPSPRVSPLTVRSVPTTEEQPVMTRWSLTSVENWPSSRGDWVCKKCSYHNVDKYNDKCALCGLQDDGGRKGERTPQLLYGRSDSMLSSTDELDVEVPKLVEDDDSRHSSQRETRQQKETITRQQQNQNVQASAKRTSSQVNRSAPGQDLDDETCPPAKPMSQRGMPKSGPELVRGLVSTMTGDPLHEYFSSSASNEEKAQSSVDCLDEDSNSFTNCSISTVRASNCNVSPRSTWTSLPSVESNETGRGIAPPHRVLSYSNAMRLQVQQPPLARPNRSTSLQNPSSLDPPSRTLSLRSTISCNSRTLSTGPMTLDSDGKDLEQSSCMPPSISPRHSPVINQPRHTTSCQHSVAKSTRSLADEDESMSSKPDIKRETNSITATSQSTCTTSLTSTTCADDLSIEVSMAKEEHRIDEEGGFTASPNEVTYSNAGIDDATPRKVKNESVSNKSKKYIWCVLIILATLASAGAAFAVLTTVGQKDDKNTVIDREVDTDDDTVIAVPDIADRPSMSSDDGSDLPVGSQLTLSEELRVTTGNIFETVARGNDDSLVVAFTVVDGTSTFVQVEELNKTYDGFQIEVEERMLSLSMSSQQNVLAFADGNGVLSWWSFWWSSVDNMWINKTQNATNLSYMSVCLSRMGDRVAAFSNEDSVHIFSANENGLELKSTIKVGEDLDTKEDDRTNNHNQTFFGGANNLKGFKVSHVDLVLSNNSKVLVVGFQGMNGRVLLYEDKDDEWQFQHSFGFRDMDISSIAFSGNGKILAVTSEMTGETCFLKRNEEADEWNKMSPIKQGGTSISLSFSGNWAVIGNRDPGMVLLYSLDGEEFVNYDLTEFFKDVAFVASVAITDEQLIVGVKKINYENAVRVYNLPM